jgi:hypothetical protein
MELRNWFEYVQAQLNLVKILELRKPYKVYFIRKIARKIYVPWKIQGFLLLNLLVFIKILGDIHRYQVQTVI